MHTDGLFLTYKKCRTKCNCHVDTDEKKIKCNLGKTKLGYDNMFIVYSIFTHEIY